MRIKRKKLIFGVAAIGVLLLSIHVCLTFYWGDINYSQTFSSHYDSNAKEYKIINSWGELCSRVRLWNISIEPTCPGYAGILMSGNGSLDYEYGAMVPALNDFAADFHDYELSVNPIENGVIAYFENEDHFGVYKQIGRQWPFIIYPSKVGKEMKADLKFLISKSEFN